MKISINDTDQGNSKEEVEGPGGASMPGGEVTPPQDADAELDASIKARIRNAEVEQQQQAGKVEQQTIHAKPSAENPETGLPSDGEDAEKKTDELSETRDQLRQVAADFENFKRQAGRREIEARERAVRGVIEDFLPVLDNFERAVLAAKGTTDIQSLRMGVEFILQQFEEALKNHGVEPIAAQGKSFDPKQHEALEEVESQEKPGTIVDDVQKGYSFKGQILRPSRVRVAK